MSKPTLEEQVKALATLRSFALRFHDNTSITGLGDAAQAFNTLDDADLFADLDEVAYNREAAEHNRKQNSELHAARPKEG
jgi:hypothetical protein